LVEIQRFWQELRHGFGTTSPSSTTIPVTVGIAAAEFTGTARMMTNIGISVDYDSQAVTCSVVGHLTLTRLFITT